MLFISTPQLYVNQPGVVGHAADYFKNVGKKFLIVGSEHALAAIPQDFYKSFCRNEMEAKIAELFVGYPSETNFNRYAEQAKEFGADALIGIGGGRVMDSVKAAAGIAGIPAIAIPTVAATCACWASLVVQYNDEGAYERMRVTQPSPKIILADPQILLAAPKRYLFSGIVDTYAKFYENRPFTLQYPDNVTFKIALFESQWAYDRMNACTFPALEEAKRGEYGQNAKDLIDSIFYMAGASGSYQEEFGHYVFAHPFYHVSTQIASSRHRLHGEKVAFGILTQLVLEDRPDSEVAETVRLFDQYRGAFTLEELGLAEEADLEYLAEQIPAQFPYADFGKEKTIAAFRKTDEIVRAYRKEQEES